MAEINTIVNRVRLNCDISDSEHAGLYTVCGLALRLRDLYKWENNLPPWEERDSSDILEWIDSKEETWNTLPSKNFAPIPVSGQDYDPFNTIDINKRLEPEGLFYGAGYARSLKPTFFLAHIEDKQKINGHTVYTLGQELARDLLTIPALAQDNQVVLRKDSAMLFLWDQIVYIKESGKPALTFALDQCGIKRNDTSSLKKGLKTVFAFQKEIYIYHEIGEIHESVFDRQIWQEMISTFPHTPVELLARAIKDILADTSESGVLHHIVSRQKAPCLAFYTAFLDGLAKELFPELRPAFTTFMTTGQWTLIEDAIETCFLNAQKKARMMTDIFLTGKEKHDEDWARQEIERNLLGDIKGLGHFKKTDL